MGYLNTHGWIEVVDRRPVDAGPDGRRYAYCADGAMLWVRRSDERYKCTQVGGSDSIEAAAALAGIISKEPEFWVDATEAAKQGWPLYGPDQELATRNALQERDGCP
jgi:hypothetical protein